MYSYNYLFLQIFIISFCISINQLKSVHPFGTTAGVIRVKSFSLADSGVHCLHWETRHSHWLLIITVKNSHWLIRELIVCIWKQGILIGC